MDKELLQRYIEGSVTNEEAERVVDWLDEDEENVKEFMALHKVFDISVMNQSVLQETPKRNIRIQMYPVLKEVLKVAAVVLFVLGFQQLISDKDDQKTEVAVVNSAVEPVIAYQTLYVPAGQRAEFILPDSTRVWLNSKSELKYPTTFSEESRYVELVGEAFFSVKKNPESPFVVTTPNVNVQVYGTEFNVSSYKGNSDYEVALLEGNVWLQGQKLAYKMKPGEMVSKVNGEFITKKIPDMDYFKWKDGIISFYKEPIAKIMDRLSLYFDVDIQYSNQNFLQNQYTGKFRVKDGVEQVLKVLQLEHHFYYKLDSDRNVIKIH